jgi:hypothetical protein
VILVLHYLQAASKVSGSQRAKLIPAKVTSKIDSHRPSSGGGAKTPRPASSIGPRSGELGVNGVAPPMSSVIVERHQPVSKVNIIYIEGIILNMWVMVFEKIMIV